MRLFGQWGLSSNRLELEDVMGKELCRAAYLCFSDWQIEIGGHSARYGLGRNNIGWGA